MGDHRAVVIGHEIVEGDDLPGGVLAALVVRVNQDHPALLRINPSFVTTARRPRVRRWAERELQAGSDLSILRSCDMEATQT